MSRRVAFDNVKRRGSELNLARTTGAQLVFPSASRVYPVATLEAARSTGPVTITVGIRAQSRSRRGERRLTAAPRRD